MGGKIWKEQSIRLGIDEYLVVLKEIRYILEEYVVLNVNEIKEIAYIKDKKDFGDLDLLLTTRFEHKSFLLNYLSLNNYLHKTNGNVVSFLYKNFQVDIIFVNVNEIAYARHYFSWNDVGNLVGRLIKQLGFKHGHNGLFYVNKKDTQVLSTTLVSLDYFDALRFLKLDVETFKKGFNTKKEMFDWIISSPYFNKNIFTFENLNHINKLRQLKRPMYNEFLVYLESKDNLTEFNYKLHKESLAIYHFPILENIIKNDARILEENTLIKTYFNGLVIGILLDLKNISLGNFMKYFKENTDRDNLLKLIAINNEEKIKNFILNHYIKYQSNLIKNII